MLSRYQFRSNFQVSEIDDGMVVPPCLGCDGEHVANMKCNNGKRERKPIKNWKPVEKESEMFS